MPRRRSHPELRIGCAAWQIAAAQRDDFPRAGSALSRYAARLSAVEINSSFYREHRPATYARWAGSVPAHFRFAVKAPRAITHGHRLQATARLLDTFLGQVGGLGASLGCLLFQLPPSLGFDRRVVQSFLAVLRKRHTGTVMMEPRHPSWFTARVDDLLGSHAIGRAAADPAIVPMAAEPGACLQAVYYRLHGSPHKYYSPYGDDALTRIAAELGAHAAAGRAAWCIFDNTASGSALPNALALQQRLERRRQ